MPEIAISRCVVLRQIGIGETRPAPDGERRRVPRAFGLAPLRHGDTEMGMAVDELGTAGDDIPQFGEIAGGSDPAGVAPVEKVVELPRGLVVTLRMSEADPGPSAVSPSRTPARPRPA